MRSSKLSLLAATALVVSTLVALPVLSSAGAVTVYDPGITGCDTLVASPGGHHCMLPWPNDAFTVHSASSVTHRMLNLSSSLDPANKYGVHVATTYINHNDGFSPGSTIMTYVPGLSFSNTGLAPSTNIGASLLASAPVIIYDATARVKVPYFAEMDAQATDPTQALLLVHPAIALSEGHSFHVILRNLKDAANASIPPLASFDAAFHGTGTQTNRSRHIRQITQGDLAAGLITSEPYVEWDFTVASAKNLSSPALTMHKLAYAWLAQHHNLLNGLKSMPVADYAPAFTVTSSTTTAGVRDVHGTFQVPLFLKKNDYFSAMKTDRNGLPMINTSSTWTANFICVLPSTISPHGAALPTVYGHGLLGDASEVEGGSFSAALAQNMAGCATDWVGMNGNANNVNNVIRNLGDMSTFNTQVDHMLQGLVNFQFLGRLINSPLGFASSPAFRDSNNKPLFKVGQCTFMGYSQGGIMGGAVSAVSTEWTRVILGVPGIDYGGVLLNRSVDWNAFSSVFDPAYPNSADQQVVLQMAQILWDRGENDGYAQHLTKHPYAGFKAKQVFLIENYGDHQVANVSTEILARTLGAASHHPVFNPSFFGGTARSNPPVVAQWGIPALNQNAPAPAGLVLWDYGTPTPPTTNLAPTDTSLYGADPHGYGRGNASLVTQLTTFLTTGIIPNLCGTSACQSLTH